MFEKHYRIEELSLYDQLAVALMLERPAIMNANWYESMLENDYFNYRALFGFAVLCHNKGYFKKAVEIY